jgi:cobalt-zinc-cadmium efflux system membrane fusion protein
MTLVDSRTVFATANIHEKDLSQIVQGQRVRVQVSSLPDQVFEGRIAVIGSVVEGESRVVPVKAEFDNKGGQLKPGMFAKLEVLTDTTEPVLTIPQSAIVEANGRQLVFVQNGNGFEPVEVTLGRQAGNWIEIESGLFDGDRIVTQRANQLYAQSLRGGSAKPETETTETATEASVGFSLPWWMIAVGSGMLGVSAFVAGMGWASRRRPHRLLAMSSSSHHDSHHYSPNQKPDAQSSIPALVSESVEEHETPHHPH